ncbi:MAG: hypothetical protein K6G32_09100, partial [Prevotella sp.]|nr:hypothetical protein [Prevotella sp.]
REEISLYIVKKVFLSGDEDYLIYISQMCLDVAIGEKVCGERAGVKAVDFVPVKFHEYGICAADGEEIHAERDARLKDFSIYDSVQEVKHREQQELIEKLHRYGKHEEDYFEWHFEGECPIVAAYDYDEPCDVVILAARVDEDGDITLIGDAKNDRGNEHEIDIDELFAGQVDFITAAIGQ